MSALYGAAIGGAISGVSYGLSDAYQWQTKETILNYAYENHGEAAAVKWAANDLGVKNVHYTDRVYETKFQRSMGEDIKIQPGFEDLKGAGKLPVEGLNIHGEGANAYGSNGQVYNKGDIVITKAGVSSWSGKHAVFDASNVYETIFHEGLHPEYANLNNGYLEHAQIYSNIRSHRYFDSWSMSVQTKANGNYGVSDYRGYYDVLRGMGY